MNTFIADSSADWRRLAGIAVMVACMGLLAEPLFAQKTLSAEANTIAVEPVEDEGRVMVRDMMVLRVRCAPVGMTIKERADRIQERLQTLLVPGVRASEVTVVPAGRETRIYVKKQLLVTIDQETASSTGMKPLALARLWANNIRHAIPHLTTPLEAAHATE